MNFATKILFIVMSLVISLAVVQAQPPQGAIESLTNEQRQQIQAKLPDLRREIQPLSSEKRAERITQFFEEFKDLSVEQRQGLCEIVIRQTENQNQPANNPNSRPQPNNNYVADPNNPFNHSLTALTDFGEAAYLGKKGGLYPDGANERPVAHTDAGLKIAQAIKPLDASGIIDEANGKIVWLSIGMSNTTSETQAFFELMKTYPDKNPKLELVDGAFGGQAINQINTPVAQYWSNIVEQRLKPRDLTPEQVQVIWYKEAEMGPSNTDFEEYTTELKTKYASVMRILKQKFPNLKLVYLSPRIYAGYATTRLNPEPFAWYTGWAIKFLIEDQLKGDAELRFTGDQPPVAWLSWGPYLWANGEKPNMGGLSYAESDFAQDGTHPNRIGQQKVAAELLHFFTTDVTTVPWFVQ